MQPYIPAQSYGGRPPPGPPPYAPPPRAPRPDPEGGRRLFGAIVYVLAVGVGALLLLVLFIVPAAMAKNSDARLTAMGLWTLKTGDTNAANLQYVPMPSNVKAMIRKQWTGEITLDGKKPVYVSPNK